MWKGTIEVVMEAEHYPMGCMNWVSEEGGGHGVTSPVPSVGRAVVSEGGGEVVAIGGAGGKWLSMKQLKEGWCARRVMAERALHIHFD